MEAKSGSGKKERGWGGNDGSKEKYLRVSSIT